MYLKHEHWRAMIYYDFKVGLSEEQCVPRLQLAFNNEAPSRAVGFRWFREFRNGRNSLQDEEHMGRPVSSDTLENVGRVRKMIEGDNPFTYHMIHYTLGIDLAAVYKVMQDELKMKKKCFSMGFASSHPTPESVKISA
ncbi:Putative uncharacterized protein FLJ37770 [Eumeta japonica]|uniref:Mos1 transposase HTH domain-containing protein n=1 Tax=Eumeta variegata TaxID=151549 RepID=A0A4C2ACS3_EUMVA|nr:Putative uncharacterized protein FLJ37770 [Eumeta japonica]